MPSTSYRTALHDRFPLGGFPARACSGDDQTPHMFEAVLVFLLLHWDFHVRHRLFDRSVIMGQGTLKSYLLGFAACLILTLAAYFVASGRLFSKMHLDLAIAAIAALQGCLFLFFYLEFGQERKPRWNMTVFLFMIGVAALILVGSIWIMYHLNYNLMLHT